MTATLTHVAALLGAVSHHFATIVLVLGLLLLAGALISGVAGRSFVALAALFLIAGCALEQGTEAGAGARKVVPEAGVEPVTQ